MELKALWNKYVQLRKLKFVSSCSIFMNIKLDFDSSVWTTIAFRAFSKSMISLVGLSYLSAPERRLDPRFLETRTTQCSGRKGIEA